MAKRYPLFIVALAAVASAVAYTQMPERVPIHWNMQGVADQMGSRLFAVGMMPLVMLGLWLFLRYLPRLDPKQDNITKIRGTYDMTVAATMTLMLVAHLVILGGALGMSILSGLRLMIVAIGVLVMIIGNVLPRTRRNWIFGVRTWWTLSDDRVWERSNRVGGYIMTAAGVVVIGCAFLPQPAGIIMMAVCLLGAALWSVAYSYVVWRRLQDG